ncbi:MAG: AAA family ATPase, partial [Pseudomonadota bacterium]
QRVRRSEATTRYDWENAILAEAMVHGHTLVYDEFTRSNAKANGILLSVLEEGVLVAPDPLATADYIQAHPDFRIILTSNPHDYAGVNASPDALLDRMVTFQMARYSRETESGIVAARTGIPAALAKRIVHLVNDLSQDDTACSMRAGILIAQIAAMRLRSLALSDALLAQIAADVLGGRGIAVTTSQIAQYLAQSPQQEAGT